MRKNNDSNRNCICRTCRRHDHREAILRENSRYIGTFILALIALLTNGMPLPEEEKSSPPINVIYKTAEYGFADTIKPRLLSSGADCSKVRVIDESEFELSLCNERLYSCRRKY